MARPAARILVAEPDRLQLQLIDMLLASGGYDLTIVETGRAALQVLQTDTPDLVMLAMDLPDLPGDEICGKIRRVTRLARTPVILLAPQAGRFGLSDEARARARKVGADLVLPRPLGDKNLRERVQGLLDAREETPRRDALNTAVIEDALRDLSIDEPEAPLAAPASAPAAGAADRNEGNDDATTQELHHELATLRMENRQLKRKLAEAKSALAAGVNPEMQRTIDELERRNRGLLGAIEELKADGRGDGRGGGLFGRKK